MQTVFQAFLVKCSNETCKKNRVWIVRDIKIHLKKEIFFPQKQPISDF